MTIAAWIELVLHVAGLIGIAWLIYDHHRQLEKTKKKHEGDRGHE